jgi:hypothetical protein
LVKQDYQTEIKLLHPLFGRKHETIYVFATLLFVADSLVLLTFVQLILMFSILFILFMVYFSVGQWKSIDTRREVLRFMQILLFLQLIAIYVL